MKIMMTMATAFLVGLATLSLGVGESAAQGVKWEKSNDLDAALKKAKARKTLVMVDLYAVWCGPCKKLDQEVFTQAAVRNALGKVVSVKIDAEKGKGPDLHKKYSVRGFPTVLFLKPNGEEVDRIYGFLARDEFAKTAANYIAGKETIAVLRERLKKSPRDHALRYEVSRRLVLRGQVAEGRETVKPLLEDDSENKLGYVPRIHMMLADYVYLRGNKDYSKAIEHLRVVLEKYPKSESAKRVGPSLASAYFKQGDTRKGLRAYDTWIAAAPNEASRYNAAGWSIFQSGKHLQQGVQYCKSGLAIDPKAGYMWDTLAELYYAQGHTKLAIAAMGKAVKLDPKDIYYKKQLTRFKSGAK